MGGTVCALLVMRRYGKRRVRRAFRARRRVATKKKFTRTVKRRFKARRPMRRPRRRLFRNLRSIGNFYSRKYVFTLTQQPIDLWFGGAPGNTTILGDFDIETLANTTPFGGSTMLSEINSFCSKFEFARVKKVRMFWRTAGDRTNARFNLGAFNTGTSAGGGIAAGANQYMLGTDFCGTYPRRGNIAPNFGNNAAQPYSVAFASGEFYNTVVQQPGFKAASLWSGSRTYLPNLLRRDPTVYTRRNASGDASYQQQNNMYPVFNKWVRSNVPQSATGLDSSGDNVELTNIRYQGMNISLPQVGCYSQQQVGTLGANGDTRAVMTNGDYFTTIYLELELQWKGALSSLANPEPVGFSQKRPAPAAVPGIKEEIVNGVYNAYTENGGPPLPKIGKFTEAADAISSGLGLLSRMKRD